MKILIHFILKIKKKFKGIINFFIRSKGKLDKSSDYSNFIRDSYSLDLYKKTIEFLVKSNWQLVLSGDIDTIPVWLQKFDESIIYRSKTNLSKDEFGIFLGSNLIFL